MNEVVLGLNSTVGQTTAGVDGHTKHLSELHAAQLRMLSAITASLARKLPAPVMEEDELDPNQ